MCVYTPVPDKANMAEVAVSSIKIKSASAWIDWS